MRSWADSQRSWSSSRPTSTAGRSFARSTTPSGACRSASPTSNGTSDAPTCSPKGCRSSEALASDLSSGEVAGTGVRRIDPVVRVDVDVRVPRLDRGDDIGEGCPAARVAGVGTRHAAGSENAVGSPSTRGTHEQGDPDRTAHAGDPAMDVRGEDVLDVRHDQLEPKLGGLPVQPEGRDASGTGIASRHFVAA